MEKLRVGVIGIGQMGRQHARIYKRLPFVELRAVCENNPGRLAEATEEFGCTGYADYRELLDDPEIDAVSIVLPDNMHLHAVEYAVSRHKHILLEKPLARELADGERIYELVRSYDKVFTVGFLLRYDPRFCAVKQALDERRLGDIIHLYCRRNSPIIGPRRYIGASNLSMHVMIHDIDYINLFMGCSPVKVYAKSRSVRLREYGMDDVIYALATYENGAIACMEACWVLPENSPTIIDDRLELVGTKGVAYVDSCDKGVRLVEENGRILYPDSRHWYDVNGSTAGDLSEEILAFAADAVCGRKSVVTPLQALESLRVVDAIEKSLREGKEVSL